MTAVLALARARWRTALSYRLAMVLSLAGLLLSVVPVYFIAEALQPTMADAIRGQGDDYFGFVVLGMITFSFLGPAINGLRDAVQRGIRTGTLEAVLGTPRSPATILAGLTAYDFLWTALRGTLFLGAALLLGASVLPDRIPLAIGILGVTALAHVPFGMMAAASVLAFRTAGPFPRLVVVASALLGGVYYPTHVIPAWIEGLSAAFPLTYGLRSLRAALLEGAPASALTADLTILAVLTFVLSGLGWLCLVAGLRYARRNGNLTTY